jgi:SAM-dependent methyltransferase
LLENALDGSGPVADLRRSVEASLQCAITGLRHRVLEAERERIRQSEETDARESAARRYHEDRHRADQGRIQDYVAEQARLQGELRALRRSHSWRVTAPLRWAGQWFATGPFASPDAAPPTAVPSRVEAVPLNRLSPVSDSWGLDRGRPIDRIYIERFLEAHRADIRGRVLEVKDSGYTRQFGRDVTDCQVIDVDPRNPLATIQADLTRLPDGIAPFDCFILTQTLHIVYDIKAAIDGAARLLGPGGVLLCTIPAVSRVNNENGGLETGDYWRATQAAVRRLFKDSGEWQDLSVQTFGNVAVCAAFLYGLAAEDLEPAAFEYNDPWFPLLHTVRVRKTT